MQRNQRCLVRIGIKADHGAVRYEAMRAASAESQFSAAASANKSGACQVSQRLTQFPFVVAHDHDRPFRERRCIVSAGATIEVADISRFIFQECRVEVAEAIDFQRPQNPYINNTAVQAHTHDVSKTGPTRCAIKIAGIGYADRGILGLRIHYPDFQKERQAWSMSPLGKRARDPG
jgi:hypothetical protein